MKAIVLNLCLQTGGGKMWYITFLNKQREKDTVKIYAITLESALKQFRERYGHVILSIVLVNLEGVK